MSIYKKISESLPILTTASQHLLEIHTKIKEREVDINYDLVNDLEWYASEILETAGFLKTQITKLNEAQEDCHG